MRHWGLPPDTAAWCAAIAGALLLLVTFAAPKPWRQDLTKRIVQVNALYFVGIASACSLLLSACYVHFYLGGGPRIIDATSYLLDARLLANGQLAFEPPGALASSHSRFLHATAEGELTPIFPPGYPLLLALGVLLGQPMWVGPVLAAILTAMSYLLARRVFGSEAVARGACAMSALCAVLRYHTADTMSHGWASVLLCSVLYLAIVGRDEAVTRHIWWAPWLAGLFAGWLFATRPLTGLVACGAYALCAPPSQWIRAATTALAGVFAFFWHQKVLTGRWGGLVQHDYYDTVDGPVGCVRLGFGSDVGCRVEHGEFIQRYMPDGFGPWEALGTTGRRLAMHLSDAGNIELFAPFLLLAIARCLPQRKARLLSFTIVTQVVIYASFYFDGNYPGGGARMFAELLPLEHALLAWVAWRHRLLRFVVPTMLLGFAVHTSFDHRHLAEREGGRPMYEPAVVPPSVEMVFVNTDHGFNLGANPRQTSPIVLRFRGDGYDYASWSAAGRPRAAIYEFDPEGKAPPTLEPYHPRPRLRFEAESNWPARKVHGGWIEPIFSATACTSGGRALRLNSDGSETPTAWVELWTPAAGLYSVEVSGTAELALSLQGRAQTPRMSGPSPPCEARRSELLSLAAGTHWLAVQGTDRAQFDYVELIAAPTLTLASPPERANCGHDGTGPCP